ncbi:MAG TPA: glycosyltransferase family 39 protein [Anaerolineales bacterium]|nr:glycosyltransferase family 39 protein [Anaerolineales bacterium]
MNKPKDANPNDLIVLILLALGKFILHLVTNDQYGFHRDELATLDDARFLAWGYVSYPPLTPFLARIQLELFGTSLVGFRILSSLAQSIALVIAGLMAHELGGSRRAQVVAAIAVAIAPMSLISGALFQYVSFDYLWWVLIAYLMIRLLKSGDSRWWLAIGAVIGIGMLTKYTILYLVAGLALGILLTGHRRDLRSPWLWGGAAVSLLLFLPNLIWQIRHDFVSLEFLFNIHARDIAIGRTEGFLPEQFIVSANVFTIPFWIAGLYFYFFKPEGSRYRPLGWMYVIPFLLFLITEGRSYYLAPAYPMLIAAGAVLWEGWLQRLAAGRSRLVLTSTWIGLTLGAAMGIALMLPVAPVGSGWWNIMSEVHDNFVEQIGWVELTESVAEIYAGLPAAERARAGILTANYGEAGAINLYGPTYSLPRAISGVNSYWLRGYGNPPPETLVVLGFDRESVNGLFRSCEVAGQVTNRFGVENEETSFHPDVFLCRQPRYSWPELWEMLRSFA